MGGWTETSPDHISFHLRLKPFTWTFQKSEPLGSCRAPCGASGVATAQAVCALVQGQSVRRRAPFRSPTLLQAKWPQWFLSSSLPWFESQDAVCYPLAPCALSYLALSQGTDTCQSWCPGFLSGQLLVRESLMGIPSRRLKSEEGTRQRSSSNTPCFGAISGSS